MKFFLDLKLTKQSKFEKHPFHLVDASPWPFCVSMSLFGLTVSSVAVMHRHTILTTCPFFFVFGFFVLLLFFMFCWFRDIFIESVYQGKHTTRVVRGLLIGFFLFILSEVMFFFFFFWAFFSFSLSPSIWIGGAWPPVGVRPVKTFLLPLVNTVILLTSGAFVTYCHMSVIGGRRSHAIYSLCITIFLGTLFLIIQAIEYFSAKTCFNDSVYGSIFYLITGFHGLHVIVGLIMLIICLKRLIGPVVTIYPSVHVGLTVAVWY